MVKVIFTILLMIIGSKPILDGATTAYKDFYLQSTTQEEESKNDKEENKSSKKHFEELYWSNFLENASDIDAAMLPYFLTHQQPYSEFVNKLTTPPPDFI